MAHVIPLAKGKAAERRRAFITAAELRTVRMTQ